MPTIKVKRWSSQGMDYKFTLVLYNLNILQIVTASMKKNKIVPL